MFNSDGFCSGLKPSKYGILLQSYRLKRISVEKLEEFLNDLKDDNFKEYNDFLKYKHLVEKRTPNLKEIYYEFLDGKRETLDFDLFFL
ncbi:hypothetical protein [uncultured Methanobrevibacter sp.]|uniref:hypothetical protein n=1 Tax=uncultured Methanobrevibacter sp. TaxID=253161 RepID=UPI0026196A9A|nr:hypothetical protein [uncultured Methanobrevibacter sp.]